MSRCRTHRALALLFAAGLSLLGAAAVRAETLDIQAVGACRPGENSAQIPDSLAPYRGELAMHAFGAFSDAGKSTVQLSPATPKSSVKVGKFTLEIVRQEPTRSGHLKIAVTVMEDSKVVLNPIMYGFGKEKTKQLLLPDGKKTTIVFFTAKE